MKNSMYPYCDDCTLPFQSQEEKDICGLYWRPQSGTKHGFPIDGWNCPKDSILGEHTKEGDTESNTMEI